MRGETIVSSPRTGIEMPVYMVERDLLGIKMERLAAAQKAAIQAGKELTAQGKQGAPYPLNVCTWDNKCMCLFEASNPENVREASQRAKIPFSKIVPALDLTP